MNKTRRSKLSKLREQIEEIRDCLEELTSEEQDAYDNLPKSIKYSERGGTMTEAIDALEDALFMLDDAFEQIEEVTR